MSSVGIDFIKPDAAEGVCSSVNFGVATVPGSPEKVEKFGGATFPGFPEKAGKFGFAKPRTM